MHPYQNAALPVEDRITDLLGRLTLAEKAGLMFHTMIAVDPDGTIADGNEMIPSASALLEGKLINHVNILTFAPVPPERLAQWHNRIQEMAAGIGHGIPVTVSTDPRHGVIDNPAASAAAGGFSAWPEPIGLGATKDPSLVREFADTVRQEYLATGIRVALHPMADLATEPRWARTNGTLGSDADMVSTLIREYVLGLQGDTLGPSSVAAMVKHFPGAGPQKDGEDAHFHYGREQVYPGGMWDHHLKPFEAAFEAGAAQVMPYYGMPVGTSYEEVGFSFSQGIIDGLLRQRYGFDGVVCTDWGLVTDAVIMGSDMPARAWGVEHLDRHARVLRILTAGADQLGGEHCPELIVDLVTAGRLPEARIDVSARRLLRDKFRLGLFDDRRYVDPAAAARIAGRPSFRAAGLAAQRRSIVLLTNHPASPSAGSGSPAATLPLAEGVPVYLDGVDPGVAAGYAKVVDDPALADVAIVRRAAPYDPRGGGFEAFFHAGRLEWTPDELAPLLELAATLPTVVDVRLDRPAVLTPLATTAAALTGSFGSSDEALLDVLFGRSPATGTLPFELPSSMAEVEASREDVPNDTADPLFPDNHGLRLP
ncbi:glycoside hydrolase family 3 N-terminal domain-containing protein [Actinoplanes sichuanensis]|uniref:beta-glucosidase n=1 Tax=Actinoplanes sichuanensis TaxID=512349 RepID=A0ABW4AA89_9ACTN|nr:glycoside hydrolase family 3 N-terminal domain-containing protein [Actinoplanes sichuanensis]BEL09088.1 glycoside hydrolase family 3 N-terminal domain-containing protein [Actinoplanes sichuanensis]